MAAIFLIFGASAFAQNGSGVIVHNAMTKGHQGQHAAHMAGHKAGHPSGGRSAGHHGWKSSLNKEQQGKIEAMHLELSRDMAPLKAELVLRKAELKNLVTADDPNMVAVKAKIKKISAIKAKILLKKYSYIIKMRKILNPDQRRSFDIEFISNAEHWQGHYKRH
ncbi:MAG: Spy/CpxP family protein refolding chaperone [Thermodesulfobacteriota bacterium]